MFVRISRVSHVGSLDPASRTARASLEGPCLSVSVNPDDWGHIARVSGPVWELSCPDAKWLDACILDNQDIAGLMDWAADEGLARKAQIWRAWYFDGEADDWWYSRHASKQAALYELEEDCPEEDVPSSNGEALDSIDGWQLSEKGMAALERWADDFDGEAGVIILYAMLKLAPEMPDLAGIWWDEIHDPLSLSCPRGGILPGRLDLFEIRDEYGNLPPFRLEDAGCAP